MLRNINSEKITYSPYRVVLLNRQHTTIYTDLEQAKNEFGFTESPHTKRTHDILAILSVQPILDQCLSLI
jgi:hypothetical protein